MKQGARSRLLLLLAVQIRLCSTSIAALELTFLDYENPTDASSPADNVYEVEIEATGSRGLTRQVVISVTDVFENLDHYFDTTTTVRENTNTAFYTLTATDPDAHTVTYAISGGADASKFELDGSNGLKFKSRTNL